MASDLITRLDAFDRDGIHMGSAELLPCMLWEVRWRDGPLPRAWDNLDYCDEEQEAEAKLRAHGAVTIRRETGRK